MSQDMAPLLGYRLKLAQHALHRRMEEALTPLDLSPAQYAVLAELNVRSDQTNADLAERAFITPQSMQSVLSRLEAQGLVERRQDSHHGRRQLARLTAEGQTRAGAANTAVMRIETELEAAVAPNMLDEALAMMERFHNAMVR